MERQPRQLGALRRPRLRGDLGGHEQQRRGERQLGAFDLWKFGGLLEKSEQKGRNVMKRSSNKSTFVRVSDLEKCFWLFVFMKSEANDLEYQVDNLIAEVGDREVPWVKAITRTN